MDHTVDLASLLQDPRSFPSPISISRESVMISTYKAIRWFRASRSRKLGHVLVARDRLVLDAETDWVTRGYKFRILEFCLGDPVPPPALDSVPHNGTYLFLSAQLVLTYHNVCPYKNRISIRSEPASFVAAFTMERKNSGKKGVMNENRVYFDR